MRNFQEKNAKISLKKGENLVKNKCENFWGKMRKVYKKNTDKKWLIMI